MTKSVAWPPSWKPTPPPSRRIIAGALHGPVKCSPLRQVMAPLPQLPLKPTASLRTEGITITHSALSKRSVGMLSGISRISFRTVPQLSRRSASFWSSAAESGKATRANATTVEIIRLITVHLVVGFWARAIIECSRARRNLAPWKRSLLDGPDQWLVL